MNQKRFSERLRQNPRPVVVDFWAAWCGPCRAIAPRVEQLKQAYAGRVDVWKVNADEQPDLLRELRIYGIPTVIAYHQGTEVTRRTGVGTPATLAGLFEAALAGVRPAQTGPAPLDRALRLGIGALLIGLAVWGGLAGANLLLGGLGAIILFSAVYDRCPIYRAVSARLGELLRRNPKRQLDPEREDHTR